MARTVLLRLGRLPSDAIAVARAIAVLGDGASFRATASFAGLDERRSADATHALIAAEILRPEPPLGFVHALVRDAVYHELALSERELAHERAARVLADLGAAPEVVAGHLLAVPSRGERWVADVLVKRGGWRRVVAIPRVLFRTCVGRLMSGPLIRIARDCCLSSDPRSVGQFSVLRQEHLREAYRLLEVPLQRGLVAEILAGILWMSGAGMTPSRSRRPRSRSSGNGIRPAAGA